MTDARPSKQASPAKTDPAKRGATGVAIVIGLSLLW